jgi:hypothetical protein
MTSMQWDDNDLADALEALRRDEACVEAPPHVEAAVLAAWDRTHGPQVEARAGNFWQRAGAIAASVIVAASLGQLARELHRTTRASMEPALESRTLLLVGEPILQGEPVRVVRMRVPAATLTGMGVRSVTGDAAAHVDVDVIVGEDGIARAIRVGM